MQGRVVRDGNLLTGGGVTAGIDFVLTLVAGICGTDVARAIQLQIEYTPTPPFDASSPDTAPANVLGLARECWARKRAQREALIGRVAARLAFAG